VWYGEVPPSFSGDFMSKIQGRHSSRPLGGYRSVLTRVFVPIVATLLGCGSAEGTAAPAPARSSGVTFVVDTVRCPVFAGFSLLPSVLTPGTYADVEVTVRDPDGTRLALAWTATSGTFTERSSPITRYRCDELGDQVLTLSATDVDDCERKLNLDLTCLEE